MFLRLVLVWCRCLWVLACSRSACASPFHPIAKITLFSAKVVEYRIKRIFLLYLPEIMSWHNLKRKRKLNQKARSVFLCEDTVLLSYVNGCRPARRRIYYLLTWLWMVRSEVFASIGSVAWQHADPITVLFRRKVLILPWVMNISKSGQLLLCVIYLYATFLRSWRYKSFVDLHMQRSKNLQTLPFSIQFRNMLLFRNRQCFRLALMRLRGRKPQPQQPPVPPIC